MKTRSVEHRGRPALAIDTDAQSLVVLLGPLRILDYRVEGGRSLLADLPDDSIDGRYPLIGGHRLWAGPESKQLSYAPETSPVAVEIGAEMISLTSPADNAGVGKAMTIRPTSDAVEITHELTSYTPQRLAPWAITQLEPGGTALLPLPEASAGLQAIDSISIWPYTDPTIARLARPGIEVPGRVDRPFKVGVGVGRGWLAYRVGTDVFVKRSERPDGQYVDRGAAYQVYACPTFVELESLGPLQDVGPGAGESAVHTESWSMHRVPRDLPDSSLFELLA